MIPPPIYPYFLRPITPPEQQQQTQDEPIEGDDYFDLLPDPIVGVILNRVLNAKSLCRCLLVSKRFAAIVPQVDSISVVAKPILSLLYPAAPKKSYSRAFLKSLFRKLLFPSASPKKSNSRPNFIGPADLSNWISNSVKNFPEIRHLRVQLPDNGGIVGFPDTGGILKWSAEFGKELERCAVIGATSFKKPSIGNAVVPDPDQQLLTDSELKSRVVWILSCLIAACARHGVVKQTLKECPSLISAAIMDSRQVGRLSMNQSQIKELTESINSGSSSSLSSEADVPIWKRTTVPNVIVKLWYAPELVLPRSGYVMKGATVVSVRQATGQRGEDGAGERECEALFSGGFGGGEEEEEAIGEAVREILKSKWKLMYKLEMNSF